MSDCCNPPLGNKESEQIVIEQTVLILHYPSLNHYSDFNYMDGNTRLCNGKALIEMAS